MKRIGLFTGIFLLTTVTFAQTKELSETLVESPRFNYNTSVQDKNSKSPICSYIKESLNNSSFYSEGVCILLFTINEDGTVSDFKIENSVSNATDKAVIDCIKSTSGMWNPGLVNGNPVEMQRKIFVNFLDPNHESLEKIAQTNTHIAIKKFQSANELLSNQFSNKEKTNNKALKKINSALKHLTLANKMKPSEPTIIFWQACAYEKLGNDLMKDQKMNEFLGLINPSYQATIVQVDIELM